MDMRHVARYGADDPLDTCHKRLNWFLQDDDPSGVNPEHVGNIRNDLGAFRGRRMEWRNKLLRNNGAAPAFTCRR